MRRLWPLWAIPALVVLAATAYLFRGGIRDWMWQHTGEEDLLPQIRGTAQYFSDLIRPPLHLQPDVPIAHNGVNPFGINTFLEQEVEPAKRERQVQMMAEAGFHWLRQEFPWYDIEIDAKGNFEDCRFPPCKSAWDKYDQIVDLADRYGLEIVARLSSPPEWSQTDRAARGDFVPPDDFTDFADFAAAVAERYRGRVIHFQIWNEPNIYHEWGKQPVDPEAYTALLCEAYARLKAVDPGIVVLSGALAPNNELGALNEDGGNNLNDFIYLQRMYDAGAGRCFDVLSMQGYGLFSGPTDRRRRPILTNFNRPALVRDVMVRNGDAGKAIWISEMNWNAAPPSIASPYGQVSEERQARYAPLAYERAQDDWPWVGVNHFWFFKRADDSVKDQAWYYFRMAEPDFTPLPVYESMKAYIAGARRMHPGYFQEDHWAVEWSGGWRVEGDARAVLGAYREISGEGSLSFEIEGTSLLIVPVRQPNGGRLRVSVDGGPPREFDLASPQAVFGQPLAVASGLPDGTHAVRLEAGPGQVAIDGFIVRRENRAAAWLAFLAVIAAGLWQVARRSRKRTPSAKRTNGLKRMESESSVSVR